MRKTIKVEEVKKWANKQLDFATQDFKAGVCLSIETVLHSTGNYNGFNYNYWTETGFELWQKAGKPETAEKDQYIGPKYNRHYY